MPDETDKTELRDHLSCKEYLGDGAYARLEFGAVVLTTEDGINTTNTVVLEREVLVVLQRYIEKHFGKL